MINLENILIFLSAPLITGLFFLKGETKRFISFFLTGIAICFLSTYINSFFVAMYGTTATEGVIKLTPIIEEIMKALPLLFYIIVFTPNNDIIFKCSVAIGIGFATFENCCYVVANGADDIYFVLIRGFAVGIMHILCSSLFGWSFSIWYKNLKIYWIGILGSISLCITYHSVYNLMVSASSNWQLTGYFMPCVTAVIIILLIKLKIKN